MFWSSVLHGFKVLAHWEVWLALVLYGVATFVWLWLIGRVLGGGESGKRQVAGCFVHAIGGTLYQGLLQTLLVVWLMPIMLGGDDAIDLSYVPSFIGPLVFAAIISTVVVFFLTIVPLVGSLLENTPGLDTFLQGMIIFRLFSASYLSQVSGDSGGSVYPGFWHSAGYVLVALVATWTLMLSLSALAHRFSKSEEESEGVLFLLAPSLLKLAGLLPLFMYAGYVAQNLGYAMQ